MPACCAKLLRGWSNGKSLGERLPAPWEREARAPAFPDNPRLHIFARLEAGPHLSPAVRALDSFFILIFPQAEQEGSGVGRSWSQLGVRGGR